MENFQPLQELMDMMESLLCCSFIPALGILAGLVMGFGYEQILNHYEFCPTVITTGG